MIINCRKLEKKNFLSKIAKAGVIKILITIPLTLETMRQLIIKPWRRSLGPWGQKKDKKLENIQKKTLKNCKYFLKTANIKILKTIPLHLEAMR